MGNKKYTFEQFAALVRKHEDTIKQVSAFFYMPNSYHFREMMTHLTTFLWQVYSQMPSDVVIFNEKRWIFTILYRQASNHAREDRLHNNRLVYGYDLSEYADAADVDPRVTRMYHLIDKLGEEDREIIIMYLDKVAIPQIAYAKGKSISYIYRRISKIRDELRRLNQLLDDDDD